MHTLTLRMKLFVAFGTLLAILVLSAISGFRTIDNLNQAARLVERKAQEKELALALTGSVLKESTGARMFLFTGEEQEMERETDGRNEYAQIAEKLAPLVQSEPVQGEAGRSLYAE